MDRWYSGHWQVFDPGRYLFEWGVGQLDSPVASAIDAAGSVFVSDPKVDTIYKFDGTGHYVTQWRSLGSGPGQFHFSARLDVDQNGNVYVVDGYNNRIQKFTNGGTYVPELLRLAEYSNNFQRATEPRLITRAARGEAHWRHRAATGRERSWRFILRAWPTSIF